MPWPLRRYANKAQVYEWPAECRHLFISTYTSLRRPSRGVPTWSIIFRLARNCKNDFRTNKYTRTMDIMSPKNRRRHLRANITKGSELTSHPLPALAQAPPVAARAANELNGEHFITTRCNCGVIVRCSCTTYTKNLIWEWKKYVHVITLVTVF